MIRGTTHVLLVPHPLRHASGKLVATAGANLILNFTSAEVRGRVHYLSYNPQAVMEIGFSFSGAPEDLILYNKITVPGSVIAKDFGDFSFLESGFEQPLYIWTSADGTVFWNVFYTEITVPT